MGGDWKEWRKIERYNKSEAQILSDLEFNHEIDKVYRELWSYNVAEAIKHGLPYISNLYGTRNGKPCVVCGAGPSLLRERETLIEAHKRGWDVVCTDRSLQTVREIFDGEHVEAFSVTTECQPDCGDFMKAAGKGDMAVVNLISCPETRNTLLERGATVYHTAPMNPVSMFWNWVYNEDFVGTDRACNRQHIVVTFGTVDIAYWMGYGPIVTIGNDLCYDTPESCVVDSATILHHANHIYVVYDDPYDCVRAAERFCDGGSVPIRKLDTGEWTFGSVRRIKKHYSNKATAFLSKNKHRLRKRSDAGSGMICRVMNGTRWSFETFLNAANGFQLFPVWHPEDTWKFQDASGGLAMWPQINFEEYLNNGVARTEQEKMACG